MKYTWMEFELYNKDGVKVIMARAKENGHAKAWKIVENGVARKATHEEVSPYIDPDFKKRQERKQKRLETIRKDYAKHPGSVYEKGKYWA